MSYQITIRGMILPAERLVLARQVGHRLVYWVYADAGVVNAALEQIKKAGVEFVVTPIPVLPDGTVAVPAQEGYYYVTGGVINLN